ncbi:Dicer-like protein 1 [Mortierella sp. AD094]|nr:Dicer-like protein 1 [Mortierella sp. AD094]
MDGQYTCDLTLPDNVPCPMIRVIQTTKYLAKSVAARDACAILEGRGELDGNLAPARAPRVTPANRIFGNVKMTEARQRELGLLPVPIEMLHIALAPHSEDITSSSWALLGEAFLKFYLGSYFFARHQDDSVEALTIRLKNESRPEVLTEYFILSGLAQSVCPKAGQSKYSVKGAREIFRRVLGAAAVHGGVNAAIKITKALGAGVDPAITSISGIRAVHQLNRVVDLNTPITIYNTQAPRIVDAETAKMIQQVQGALGYEFEDTQLLLEAMTHESATMEASYDRLELLGDAVLEFSVTEYYYRKCPDVPLEDFKTFKRQVLSNNILGSLYASLGLEDTIIIGDQSYKNSLKEEAARAIQFKPSRDTDWLSLDLDKTLGDAMEALIGAVFVDGGFAIEPVQEILSRTLVPFVDRSGLECPTLATSSAAATCSAVATLSTGIKRKKARAGGSRKRVKN